MPGILKLISEKENETWDPRAGGHMVVSWGNKLHRHWMMSDPVGAYKIAIPWMWNPSWR